MPSGKPAERLERVEIASAADLRRWLKRHHQQRESVWIVTWKKGSPNYVSWSELLDEALCFGWIDSLSRKLDGDQTMRLLSPRRPNSDWSQVNKVRVESLMAAGRMTPAGVAAVNVAKGNGHWDALTKVDDLVVPDDLRSALQSQRGATDYFSRFPPSSRRGILEWISGAKAAGTRQRRIEDTAAKAAQNIKANHPKGRDKGPAED